VDQDLNPEYEAKAVCASCASPDVLDEHPVKLCANCRDNFIKFPIPLWVKLFGAGIGVVMIISIIWLPKNFETAIALSKAEKAEKNKNYITEQHELEKAEKGIPNLADLSAHMVIASFYNLDMVTMGAALKKIENKSIDDADLIRRVNDVVAAMRSYYPSGAYDTAFSRYKKVPDTALQRFVRLNPTDVNAIYMLAQSYIEKEKYNEADTILSRVLQIEPDLLPGMYSKGMVKREIDQLDSSIYYCDKALEIDHQSVYALSCKARTIMKSGRHKEGLDMALKVEQLNKTDPYNTSTLAIAYHFNSNFAMRDQLLHKAEKDSTLASYMKYARDVISGKEKYK